jgi:hypothetical protein
MPFPESAASSTTVSSSESSPLFDRSSCDSRLSPNELSRDALPSKTCGEHVARTFVAINECAHAGVRTGVGGHCRLGDDDGCLLPALLLDSSNERSRLDVDPSPSNAIMSGMGRDFRWPPLRSVESESREVDNRYDAVFCCRFSDDDDTWQLDLEELKSASSSGIPGIGEHWAASS